MRFEVSLPHLLSSRVMAGIALRLPALGKQQNKKGKTA